VLVGVLVGLGEGEGSGCGGGLFSSKGSRTSENAELDVLGMSGDGSMEAGTE
jgi:hypothetical protein